MTVSSHMMVQLPGGLHASDAIHDPLKAPTNAQMRLTPYPAALSCVFRTPIEAG